MLLLQNKVTPVVVLDGQPLPMKSRIDTSRRKARELSRAKAEEHLRNGDYRFAKQKFAESVAITRDIKYALIEELRKLGITYYVAPFEADAQLGFLAKQGHVDFVISEDSDLVLFGVRRLFLKMDGVGSG